MTLDCLVQTLGSAGVELQVEDVLDALWLATRGRDLTLYATKPTGETAPPVASTLESRPAPSADAPTDPDSGSPQRFPPAPADDEKTPVYASGAADTNERVKGSPVSIPAGYPLPGRLALARALRPFRLRWPSRHEQVLDEQQTVEATAESDQLSLVFRPLLERWFDVDVVLEDDPAIGVWQDTVRDFCQMLRDTGAFRVVRSWRLRMPPSASCDEFASFLENTDGGRVPARVLAGGGVRRLVFFVTHGSSMRWMDGSYARVIDPWSRSSSVVLLHLMDRAQWKRGALGEPHGLCYAPEPGATSADLHVDRFWWAIGDSETTGAVGVPAVPLNPTGLAELARMQMSRGRRCSVFLLDTAANEIDNAMPESEPDFERIIALLREASPEAFRLAVALAAGPFTIPVARLVQEVRFGTDAQLVHLADLLLSGLVFARSPEPGANPTELYYEVHAEARSKLLRSLRGDDADFIAAALEQRVSRHIEEIYGRPVSFRALIPDENGQYRLPAWAQPFARLGLSLLGVPAKSRTSYELLKAFRESQPIEIVRRTVGVALSQTAVFDPESIARDIWEAMTRTPLVRQDASGLWTFLPGIQDALATMASQWPLINKKLLWVDDYPDNNLREAATLTEAGATIHIATTTKEALALAVDTFDVIISDMGRGRDSQAGLTLLKALRTKSPDVPVIIYASASATTGRKRTQAMKAGAFEATSNPRELVDLVLKAAGGGQRREAVAETRELRLLAALESVGINRERRLELLRQPASQIGLEVLGRTPIRRVSFAQFLEVMRAYSGAGIHQLIAREGNRLRVIARLIDPDKSGAQYTETSWDGVIGRAAKSAEPAWVPDVSRDPDYIPAESTTRSELALPVFAQRERAVVAVVNIESDEMDTVQPSDIDWLSAFCQPLASRIESTQPQVFINCARPDESIAKTLADRLSARIGSRVQLLFSWPASHVNVADTIILLLSSSSLDARGQYKSLSLSFIDSELRLVPVIIGDADGLSANDAWAKSLDFRPSYESGMNQLVRALGFGEHGESAAVAYAEPGVVQLLYATDRRVDVDIRSGRAGGKLQYGIAHVRIPMDRRFGETGSRSWFQRVFLPQQRVTVLDSTSLSESSFARHLSDVDRSPAVHVHGYNATFEDVLMRMAQRFFDISADVVPVVYSWPSSGRVGGYMADLTTVEWASRDLTSFIGQFNPIRGHRMHLWADGLGCQIALRAIEQVIATDANIRLGQVIFVKPDIDPDVLRQVIPHVAERVERVTLYIAPTDPLLAFSRALRSARSDEWDSQILGADTIMVSTDIEGSVGTAVLIDIAELLRFGRSPELRIGLQRIDSEAVGIRWTLRDRPRRGLTSA